MIRYRVAIAASFPVIFKASCGAELINQRGKHNIDFSCRCRHSELRAITIRFEAAVDLHRRTASPWVGHVSGAKEISGSFPPGDLEARGFGEFRDSIQRPYAVPTRLEASPELARKVTGRYYVISFTNGFHAAALGALAVTAIRHHRALLAWPADVSRMPLMQLFWRKRPTGMRDDGQDAQRPEQRIDKPAT